MAIVEDFILKGCTGCFGNLVIYQVKGRTLIRTKPERREFKASEKQLEQQARVSGTHTFYRAVKATGLYRIWQEAARELPMSGYNLFLKRNIHAFTGEGLIGDFAKICLSTGTLPLPHQITRRRTGEDEWVLEWKQAEHYACGEPTDRLLVALMKREDVYTVTVPNIGDVRREAGRAVVRLSAEEIKNPHLYCFFCSATSEAFSESRYFCLTHKI